MTGIAFVAAPELQPGAVWLARHTDSGWKRVDARVRLLFHRPPRPGTVYEASGGITARVTASAVGVTSVSPTAPIEQVVGHVLRMTDELQQRLGAVENRLVRINREWERADAQLRTMFEQRMTEEMRHSREAYLTLRYCGIASLIAGSALLAIASFL